MDSGKIFLFTHIHIQIHHVYELFHLYPSTNLNGSIHTYPSWVDTRKYAGTWVKFSFLQIIQQIKTICFYVPIRGEHEPVRSEFTRNGSGPNLLETDPSPILPVF